jgi:hypothetical protein
MNRCRVKAIRDRLGFVPGLARGLGIPHNR